MHIHFTPAWGFPAGTYAHVLEHIKQLVPEIELITTVNRPGYSAYPTGLSWEAMVDELLNSIAQSSGKPVVGIGHSVGATLTLAAAVKQPDLFSRLILFEPPLFGSRQRLFLRVSRLPGFRRFNPLVGNSGKGRRDFDSKEEAIHYFKRKAVFRTLHPSSLEGFVQSALEPHGTGYRLVSSKKIENKIAGMPQVFPKPFASDMDITACYGANSDFLPSLDIQAWGHKLRNLSDVVVEGGHLFPLEFPEKTADLVAGILNRTDVAMRNLESYKRQIAENIQIQRQGKMLKGSVLIEALPETVFEFVSDPERLLQWNSDMASFKILYEADDKIGSIYEFNIVNGPQRVKVKSRITGYENGKYFSAIHESFMARITAEYKCNETNGSTLLKVDAGITFKGLGKVMEFILGKVIVKMQFQNMVKSLRMLKTVCETRSNL